MDWADTTTYLGLSCSQILNLTNTALKKDKASKTLGTIKHILKQAPQEGR